MLSAAMAIIWLVGTARARDRSIRARSRALRASESWERTDPKLTRLRVTSIAALTPASSERRAWSRRSDATALSASRARTVSSAENTVSHATPAAAPERAPAVCTSRPAATAESLAARSRAHAAGSTND